MKPRIAESSRIEGPSHGARRTTTTKLVREKKIPTTQGKPQALLSLQIKWIYAERNCTWTDRKDVGPLHTTQAEQHRPFLMQVH